MQITSDHGHVGPIHWCNSVTHPFVDPYTGRSSIYWGCFVLGSLEDGVMYGEMMPLNQAQ
jgi:hypothetical protein